MRFTLEDASHAAWLVAEQLLQSCPKISPPSSSSLVSTPSFRGRFAPSREGCCAPRSLRRRAPQPSARSVPVVSHHLDGLLHQRPAGLLHPAADPGVHRVSAPRRLPTGLVRFPSDASPFRASPLTKPHPCHQGPLPSCRCGPAPSRWEVPVDFKVLLRVSVRRVVPPLPAANARSSPGLPAPEASYPAELHDRALRDGHPKVSPALSRPSAAARRSRRLTAAALAPAALRPAPFRGPAPVSLAGDLVQPPSRATERQAPQAQAHGSFPSRQASR